MKRSKMVKLLQSNSKVKLETPIASYLLRLMENADMLPPCKDNGKYNHWVDHKGGTYCCNAWEPEDEVRQGGTK